MKLKKNLRKQLKITDMITLENIIEKLEEAFKKSTEKRKESTRIFHNSLASLVENENNLVAYSSSIENSEKLRSIKKEFLVDFCLSIEPEYNESFNSITQNYSGLVLICESEWDLSEASVIYDFQKLAVIKAKYKLIVFNKVSGLTENRLIESISRTLFNDGSYYIFCYGDDKEQTISVYKNCKLENP